jgi:hypothetical protein
MIRIAISVEAFEAITATLPFGSMSFENGEKLIWFDRTVVHRLRAIRGSGEGSVKANKYRRFSASNPAERGGNSSAKTAQL